MQQRSQSGHAPPMPDFAQHDDGLHGQTTDNEEHHDAPSTPPPAARQEPSPVQPSPPEPTPVVHVNVHTPPVPAPAPAPEPVPVPAPAFDPNPELVAKLNQAQAEIERLRKLIQAMPEPSTVSAQTNPTNITKRMILSLSCDRMKEIRRNIIEGKRNVSLTCSERQKSMKAQQQQ